MQERRISLRRPIYDNNKNVQKGDNNWKEISGREVRTERINKNASVNEQ